MKDYWKALSKRIICYYNENVPKLFSIRKYSKSVVPSHGTVVNQYRLGPVRKVKIRGHVHRPSTSSAQMRFEFCIFLVGTRKFRTLDLGLSSILVFFFFFLNLFFAIQYFEHWPLVFVEPVNSSGFNPRDHCVTFHSCAFLSFLFFLLSSSPPCTSIPY